MSNTSLLYRVPVQSVVFNGKMMARTDDGYFELNGGGPFSLPSKVSITSVLGDTIEGKPQSFAHIFEAAQGLE